MEFAGSLYNFLANFFLSLGKYSVLSWQIVGILFFISLAFYCFKNNTDKSINLKYLFICCSCILIMRLPTLIANELNTDESEWMAGAMTLIFNPKFWHSVDGTTSGPLNIYPLCLIYLCGFKISYTSIRLFTIIFIFFPTIILLFHTIKSQFNSEIARITILPLVLFISFVVHYDLNAYSSEHIPILLLSFALFFSVQLQNQKGSLAHFFLGFVLGLIPYSKLQALPIGAVIGMFSVISILKYTENGFQKLLKLVFLVLGALIPTIITVIYLVQNNLVNDFFQSYIFNNISYSASTSYAKLLLGLPAMIWIHTKIALPFYITTGIIIILGLLQQLLTFKKLSEQRRILFYYALLLFLSAWYCIGKAGRGFPHYQNFILVPLIFLLGIVVGVFCECNISSSKRKYFKIIYTSLFFFSFCTMLIMGNEWLDILNKEGMVATLSPISLEIKKHISPYDKIAVWGSQQNKWGSNNKYYIEANATQATRESHSQRQHEVVGSIQNQYYLERYLSDIKQNKPKVILDLEGDTSYCSYYTSFCELLQNDYYLDTLINLKKGSDIGNCRIFVRKKE